VSVENGVCTFGGPDFRPCDDQNGVHLKVPVAEYATFMNADIPTSWARVGEFSDKSEAACKTLCENTNECKSVVSRSTVCQHENGGLPDDDSCWLGKTAVGEDFRSGDGVNYTQPEGSDVLVHLEANSFTEHPRLCDFFTVLSTFGTEDAGDCASLCRAHPDCKGYTVRNGSCETFTSTTTRENLVLANCREASSDYYGVGTNKSVHSADFSSVSVRTSGSETSCHRSCGLASMDYYYFEQGSSAITLQNSGPYTNMLDEKNGDCICFDQFKYANQWQ